MTVAGLAEGVGAPAGFELRGIKDGADDPDSVLPRQDR
jgi:hypothetical protein